jgi:hypothetical protein
VWTLAVLVEHEQRGLRCCNAAHATLTARDRVAVQQALTDADIPAPAAAPVGDVAQVRQWTADRPVVVKARKVDGGRDLGVAIWATGAEPTGSGPYLVQDPDVLLRRDEYQPRRMRRVQTLIRALSLCGLSMRKRPPPRNSDTTVVWIPRGLPRQERGMRTTMRSAA